MSAAAAPTPGKDYEAPGSSWLALVGVLVIAHLVRRETWLSLNRAGRSAFDAHVSALQHIAGSAT